MTTTFGTPSCPVGPSESARSTVSVVTVRRTTTYPCPNKKCSALSSACGGERSTTSLPEVSSSYTRTFPESQHAHFMVRFSWLLASTALWRGIGPQPQQHIRGLHRLPHY